MFSPNTHPCIELIFIKHQIFSSKSHLSGSSVAVSWIHRLVYVEARSKCSCVPFRQDRYSLRTNVTWNSLDQSVENVQHWSRLVRNRLENLRRLKPLKCFRHLKEDRYYTYIRHVRISSSLSWFTSFVSSNELSVQRLHRPPIPKAVRSTAKVCWNRGFESRLGHGHLSLVFVVCSVK